VKILDGHIHIFDADANPGRLAEEMAAAEISGGVLISRPPASFAEIVEPWEYGRRLENLLNWCDLPGNELESYPFFWLDPLEKDAGEQIEAAVKAGVSGFKIICDRYYPDDPRVLAACSQIAESDRPVLFHSGILWDGKASSKYNRPANFEDLAGIPGLRFALAHISWPWVDEHIAVYGKLESAKRSKAGDSSEMFIDTTRGTPPIYREEALTKLYTVGYKVADNVFYGTDFIAGRFGAPGTASEDLRILNKIGLPESQIEAYFSGNLYRFLNP
jgi:predicted TIM-barrel fold metal-dependent hydrolase